ncbi:MAG: class I SAM-dependent methyltransferase [Trueperaceae bacterium]|nr:class I SAM-dependent methyltransferase [Trueperaceae bacterium]
MTHEDAVALIRDGVPSSGGTWADLGAGSGVFTRALADLLGEAGVVIAVDRQASVNALGRDAGAKSAEIRALRADFAKPLALPLLDGVSMANALHFARDAETVLRPVLERVRSTGTLLLVEYDLDRGTPWIPHPVSFARFAELARTLGLVDVREVGRTRSRYGPRDIYAAAARKR